MVLTIKRQASIISSNRKASRALHKKGFKIELSRVFKTKAQANAAIKKIRKQKLKSGDPFKLKRADFRAPRTMSGLRKGVKVKAGQTFSNIAFKIRTR